MEYSGLVIEQPSGVGCNPGLSPKFLDAMLKELRANHEQKGDWKEWCPDKLTAIYELHYHTSKLIDAIRHGDKERIAEYSADCANHSMFIFHEFVDND